MHSAGAGDCLQTGDLRTVSYVSRHGGERDAYSLLLEGRAVAAKDELLGGRCEVRQTGNGQVLVVEVGVFAEDLVGLSESEHE